MYKKNQIIDILLDSYILEESYHDNSIHQYLQFLPYIILHHLLGQNMILFQHS
jgi:hypothetical protein